MKCEAPLIHNEREVFLFSEHTEKAVVRCEATGDPTPYVFFQVKSINAVLLPGQKLVRVSIFFISLTQDCFDSFLFHNHCSAS